MPTLYVLSGLPGAGKSTLARKVAAETGAILLARDPLREAMTNLPDDWLPTFLLLEAADLLLTSGYSVVVDAWNLHPDDRSRWTDLAARIENVTLEWCHLDTPVDECVRRDAFRPNPNGEKRVRAAAREYGLR